MRTCAVTDRLSKLARFSALTLTATVLSGYMASYTALRQEHASHTRHLSSAESKPASKAFTVDESLSKAIQMQDADTADLYVDAIKAHDDYRKVVSSSDGKRFAAVLDTYLGALLAYRPATDQCTPLKYALHVEEVKMDRQKLVVATANDLPDDYKATYESLGNCNKRRGIVIDRMQSCHDEAASYIRPGFQPPTDSCLWRRDRKSVLEDTDRKE